MSWIWSFLKSTPLFLRFHWCGRHGLWPSWYRPNVAPPFEGDCLHCLHATEPTGRLFSAKPAVTFPARKHQCSLAGTKLYRLVTKVQNNLPRVFLLAISITAMSWTWNLSMTSVMLQWLIIQPSHTAVIWDCLWTKYSDVHCVLWLQAGFYRVDHDYIMNSARLAKSGGCSQFHILSASGANKNSSFLYQKTKVCCRMLYHALMLDSISKLIMKRSVSI